MKFLLLPFSWIYGFIAWVRNKLYDAKLFKSYTSKIPTIVIGNLQVGGSGKTPLTAFLYKRLQADYKIAVLSRGYGRKSKGLYEADSNSDAGTLGDEPLWYYQTLSNAKVVVSEKRKLGLQYLEDSTVELVLLDDAFQHRAIKGTLEILLSDFKLPYYKDYPLPYGRLREYPSGDARANIIILTKCPSNLSLLRKVDVIKKINPSDDQHVFFTGLKIGKIVPLKGLEEFNTKGLEKLIALSGIANPDSFVALCESIFQKVEAWSYKDHHMYTTKDIEKLMKGLGAGTKVLLTEKDAVKLRATELFEQIPENTFFILPIEVEFLFNDEERFLNLVKSALKAELKKVN